MEWQQIMGVLFLALGAYIVYLYLTGRLSLGPKGQEWEAKVSTTENPCPPPDCDCNLLRARINYLDRKLHDTENALLKAEGLYNTLYIKYTKALQELEEWKARALAAEEENEVLKQRIAALLEELAACQAELNALRAQCLERAEATSCHPGLSQVGTLLR
jgi:chromosome segregation ATPase